MEFKDAKRSDVRMKLSLAGPGGAGKTKGTLLMAKGMMGGDMSKVGMIQTEAGRAQCYLDAVGPFKILELGPPYSPEKYIEAIETAEKAGLKVLIIDSISDEWAGTGGILDLHQEVSEVTKNGFIAWKKLTPRHDAFFSKILSSNLHIFATVRKKTEYAMESVNGKQMPKRVGLKDIQRDDAEYKWMLQFDLDQEGNLAKAVKDNTSIFQGKPPFKITEQTGTAIRDWCLKGDKV